MRDTALPRAAAFGALALWALAFWAAAAGAAGAQESAPLLRAEFRVQLDAIESAEGPETAGLEKGSRYLVDEAAWAFSGMVWGFGFEYEPYDKVRGIAERFALSPLGAIEPGDRRLTFLEPRGVGNELRAYVEYRPDAAGAAFLDSYGREPWASAQGTGSADMKPGWLARRTACEDALRAAVREHLRLIEHNKPRGASGRVVFERPPRIVVREGRYVAQVRARVEVTELAPYVVY